MSATSTPNDSPVVQPLHNPANAAHVVVPQAPLGNVVNQVPGAGTGLGAKALLAKKMANQSVVLCVILVQYSISTEVLPTTRLQTIS